MVDLTLRWEKFGLSRGLHNMMESQELVDVTIMCQGQFLQAHKNVLAACSQQFRQIFKSVPDKNPIVVLKGVSVDHFKNILQFMYLGEVTVSQDDLSEFISTADELGISALSRNTMEKGTSQRPPPEPPEAVSEVEVKTQFLAKSRRVTSANNESTETASGMGSRDVEMVKVESESGNEPEEDDDWSGIPLVEGLDTSAETTTYHQHQPGLTVTDGCYEGNGVPVSGSNDPGPSTSQGGESWIETQPAGTRRPSTRPAKRRAPHSPSPGSVDEDLVQSDTSTPQGLGSYLWNAAFSASSTQPHKTDNTTTSSNISFKCSYCSLMFASEELKRTHEKTHHIDGPAICTLCQKIFKHRRTLADHKWRYHTGRHVGIQHVCSVCGVAFKSKNHLKQHELNQHGDWAVPHECRVCHKICKNKTSYDRHLSRMHGKQQK